MSRARGAIGTLSALALVMTGMVSLAGPAQAAHVDCGAVITQSTTLTSDIGPCPGDGLIVRASNITLNLNGLSVTGSASTNTTDQEQVGIRLANVSNVTVRNGTVQNFDAGVAILGGSGNSVQAVNAQDNINHSTLTGALNECNFGDGIVVIDSSNNRIDGNRATGNGPFSGISLVGNSDANRVRGNQVFDNNEDNIHPDFVSPDNEEGLGPCGPFQQSGGVGRPYQDIGIRIEGPGADRNQVQGNRVTDNMLNGITIHGYNCHPPAPRPPEANNGGNVISGNTVQSNGFGDPTDRQHGIAVLQQGPTSIVCVAFGNTIIGNTSTANAADGIFVGGRGSHSNTIDGNTVNGNGRDGIRLTGPGGPTSSCGPTLVTPCPGAINNTLTGNRGTGNGEHDGHDGNPNCDNNAWRGNRFGTVNQACVAANGGSGTVAPPTP